MKSLDMAACVGGRVERDRARGGCSSGRHIYGRNLSTKLVKES